MRAFNILPIPVIQSASLSKDALKRLTWIDWYSSHGKNAELTCRHFGISKSKYEIEEELKRAGVKVSRKVIQKVINRHFELRNDEHKIRLQKSRNHKIARIKAAIELQEKDLGSLVQIDTKHLYILGQRFYVFVAIDCKSRLGFVYAYKSASSAHAADFLLSILQEKKGEQPFFI